MKTPRMTNDMGEIVSATGKQIEFSNGVKLRPDKRVQLPPAAGGHIGTVDFIQMVFNPEELKAEIHLRIEDDNGQGHLFIFPVDK
jgi:hypothetical protein